MWNDPYRRALASRITSSLVMKVGFMDIEIDLGKCQGYAQCVHEAPEIFELSESGRAQIVVAGVTNENEKYAQAAADLCPMQAISINDH